MPELDGLPGLQEQVTPDPIHLHMILDVSPSMRTRWKQTISGLNEYFDSLRKDQSDNDQPYVVTMTTFSADIHTPYKAVDLDHIPTFTEKNLSPFGWGTALYDAVGPAIKAIDTQNPVLVVIITDGEENSSHTWDESRLAKLMDERQKLGNYTYAYLGIAKEAWGNTAKMGTAVVGSMRNMTAQDYARGDTYRDVSHLTATYSAGMRSNSVARARGSSVSMSVSNFFEQPPVVEVENADGVVVTAPTSAPTTDAEGD